MLAPISSLPAETVCRFLFTWAAAAETTLACAEVSSGLDICWRAAVSSSAADARKWEISVTARLVLTLCVTIGGVFHDLHRPLPMRLYSAAWWGCLSHSTIFKERIIRQKTLVHFQQP